MQIQTKLSKKYFELLVFILKRQKIDIIFNYLDEILKTENISGVIFYFLKILDNLILLASVSKYNKNINEICKIINQSEYFVYQNLSLLKDLDYDFLIEFRKKIFDFQYEYDNLKEYTIYFFVCSLFNKKL
jgi:hypothetical protein